MAHNHPITEMFCMILTIKLQPVFGAVASVAMILYYLSMVKINVVDVKFDGSWKKYFKSFIKKIL